ncbi:hypothetical protein GCM10009764_25970 [Nocardia ninae]|uniref:DUF3558 domain-containing protein n=2 Tax=Nocardia ninae TaxID=356145 RepID=A0A511MBX1_9NOCA|nr:hypothetical protein NN4_26730 [Nocardia ninae NBRC 108245]
MLSSCDLSPHDPDEQKIRSSDHTLQQLCDIPRKFFATRYADAALEVEPGLKKPLTDKIGTGNDCSYFVRERDRPDRRYIGSALLFRIIDGDHTLSKPSPTNENYPTRVLTVDGVSVKVVTEPLPKEADPATTRLSVDLAATIDGWDGELHFRTTEGQTTPDAQAGAQVLVDLVRELKG